MHFLPENRMCAPPFVTKQHPPIWKILDPPLASIIQVITQSFLRLIDSDFSYNKIFNESMDPKRAEERSIVRINDSPISVVSSNFTHNELVSPEVGGSVMFISYYSKIEYLEGCFFAKN